MTWKMWKKNQLQKNTIERGKMVQTSCSYSVYTHEIGLAWFYPLWPSWHVDKRDHSFLDFSLEDTFFARLDPVPMTLEPTLYVVLATHLTLPMLALYSPEAIPWTQPAWGLLALPSCCCLAARNRVVYNLSWKSKWCCDAVNPILSRPFSSILLNLHDQCYTEGFVLAYSF